jgi:phospholipid transport system substrate-binding protein
MNKTFTRREFTVLAGSALAAVGLGGPARALSAPQAQSLVQSLVNDIFTTINSGKSEGAMYADFERLFARYADVSIIARQVLGADARRASPAQLAAFTEAFRGYISRKYGRRFREFIGGRIDITGVGRVKSFYEVRSIAYLRGQAPFEVKFLVSDKSGRPLFFNMLIEGVNLMLTEAAEIGARLDQRGGNIDALTADLRRAG